MRIVYVIPGPALSGGVAVVCQHANRLRARGHDVRILAERGEGNLDWFPGQQVEVIGPDRYPEDVDVLVATFWRTSFVVDRLPARKKFYFVQSDETRFYEASDIQQHLARLSYLFRMHYLTEARWIRAWLASELGHDAELVPNGLDRGIFHPAEPLEPRGARPRVLLEGAIAVPFKGMAEAFAAVAPLDAEIWCVSAAGRPREGWRCDRFFERVPISDMKRLYSSCDVLLKLSRVEGFFGPPMEMMACGGNVVVGRVTGHDEYIVDGENALVVDPHDVAGARAAVQRLLGDDALAARLRENGRATAQAWDWDRSVDVLERYFADVLAGRRSEDGAGDGPLNRSLTAVYDRFAAGAAGGAGSLAVPAPEARIAAVLEGQPWFKATSRVICRALDAWRARSAARDAQRSDERNRNSGLA